MKILNYLLKKQGAIILCCSVVIALLLSILTMTSPTPENRDNRFSAERAYSHLEVIAQKQHSVFDTNEIEDVRNYLTRTISAFENIQSIKVDHRPIEIFNHKTHAREWIDVQNMYAVIPGTSGTYLLIMAHYDSCPYKEKYGVATDGAYGAADDGYGVATMLEIMRLLNDYAAENKLVNGIKFAFTDAEEVALGGATALVNEFSHWLKDVNIVVNLEARGNKGPLYMFQTSDKNYKLIDFYSHARLPFSFSIAADVYQYLPNDTDFTPFLKEGYSGLNFSTLNSLKYYHTPYDNLDNACKATIQFYGNQIYPLVTEYMTKERYSAFNSFVSNHNAVFFTLSPSILIYYTQTISWIFSVIVALGMVAIAFFAIRKKALSWIKALLALGIWTGYLLVAAALGLLLAMLTGWITGHRFNLMYMPNVPFDLGLVVICATLVLVAGLLAAKLCKKLKCSFLEIFSGASLIIILLNFIFALLLHGGTYLFVWPAAFMLGIMSIHLFFSPDKRVPAIVWHIFHVFAVVVSIILYTTLIYSLFLALTFGALAIVLLFTALLACVLVPCGLSLVVGK